MAAEYKVKATSFFNDNIVPEGTVIQFDGEPGDNLEPLNDEARAAVAAAAERRAQKAAAIKSALAGSIDPANAETIQRLITEVQGFAGRLAAAEARVANVEAASSPDLSGYATKAGVETVRGDVGELDQGLMLLTGRVAEVEGVIASLAEIGRAHV